MYMTTANGLFIVAMPTITNAKNLHLIAIIGLSCRMPCRTTLRYSMA